MFCKQLIMGIEGRWVNSQILNDQKYKRYQQQHFHVLDKQA